MLKHVYFEGLPDGWSASAAFAIGITDVSCWMPSVILVSSAFNMYEPIMGNARTHVKAYLMVEVHQQHLPLASLVMSHAECLC